MPRPKKPRWVDLEPGAVYYKPRGVPVAALQEVEITLDELEAMQLCDVEGLHQEEAALRMGVSRPTLGRIVAEGRRKLVGAIVAGRAIRVAGGEVVQGPRAWQCRACGRTWPPDQGGPDRVCPVCGAPSRGLVPDWAGQGRGRRHRGGRGPGGGRRGGGRGR